MTTVSPLNRPVRFDNVYGLLADPELQRGSLMTRPLILLLDLPSADQRAQLKQLAPMALLPRRYRFSYSIGSAAPGLCKPTPPGPRSGVVRGLGPTT